MARTLISTNATVHTPEGVLADVRFEHRQGAATAKVAERRGQGTLAERAEVVSITQTAPRQFVVGFADGVEWTVQAKRGCGCGR